MILPDHVIDRRELLPIAHQCRSQACHVILHEANLAGMFNGTGRASSNPARYTGCAKFSGATSGAVPRNSPEAAKTDPSAIMRAGFFTAPQPAGLSTRP